MTKPEDQPPGNPPAPQPSVPSWVDEVLRVQANPQPVVTPSATETTGDLRIPEGSPSGTPTQPREDDWTAHVTDDTATTRAVSAEPANDLRIPEPSPPPAREDDWIARATGNAAKSPTVPSGPQVAPPPSGGVQDWLQPVRPTTPASPSSLPADIAQKKLIAGLLAIVFGSLGVHKFYLGMNTPGLIMLGVNIGVWILALLLGLLTLGFGLILTVPLAALVSGAIGLLGLVEGILYLTKSDEDFYRQYVLDKRPWL